MRLYVLFVSFLSSFSCFGQSADSIETHKPRRFTRAVIAPVTLVIAGLTASQTIDTDVSTFFRRGIHEEEEFETPAGPVSDLTQYAPIVLAYGLTLAGNKGEHKVFQSTSLLLQSEILMVAMVRPLKYFTDKERPDGGPHSFPSGHTAQAFVAATFLHKEYGHKSVWYSIAGYTMASTVGACRVIANRHWASDVLVGAGIGILSTNMVYYFHKHRKKNPKSNLIAMPSYNRGPGLFLSMKL